MRGRRVAAAAHFAEAYPHARLGELPRRFATGEPAADDLDVEGHAGLLVRRATALSSADAHLHHRL